ncbi:hypothetical protein F4823DRAFT_587699 [Ustulina deusta]|nr:hypothetical protein F4823DRAFT_587699 [Ustulina deusta]
MIDMKCRRCRRALDVFYFFLIHIINSSATVPALATVDHEPFSRSASITLPARPGSRFPAAHEPLGCVGALSRVMGFSIETAASGRAREHFEWRHSSGVEVEALGGRHSGWKLVRVSLPAVMMGPTYNNNNNNNNNSNTSASSFPPPRKHSSGSGSGNVVGQSSDGKEVVAVWSGVSMSLSKVLRFRFLGSGADGSLGDRWAVMAVASALAIWNRDRRSRSGG